MQKSTARSLVTLAKFWILHDKETQRAGRFLEYQTDGEGMEGYYLYARADKPAPRCRIDLHADAPLMNCGTEEANQSGHRLTVTRPSHSEYFIRGRGRA